ncbi:ADP-ribosyltransferase exoenzyme [Murinocardiopsis flavida]|uniref:ADP-ribosyltransferase exoenzyme n=1 Tax=Murinocardiopsis flavida TaxID=645275 RepID=A0A2P8DQJ5_9ACTN|nr:ADP-ribosyltransferase [Murinocardiopsis flavida]PSK99454.1 ADP-ribosyltransferase exoenzyme [Murinocardiopsis flavida]
MLRRIHDPERGASLIEYAATIVLAAAILAGLINSGITTSITGGVTGALEKLTVPDEGDPVGQQPGATRDDPGLGPQPPGTGADPQPQGGKPSKGDPQPGGAAASKDAGKGGGGSGGALRGLNMTSIGVGGPFNPGVNILEGLGGKNWFDDLSNHDVWLDPDKHLPEVYGTDMFPGNLALRLGLQQAGLSGDDFGWFGEQYTQSNKMLGDLWKDMLAGSVNTALHPQQMAQAAWDSSKKAVRAHADGLTEIVAKNLKESNGSLFKAGLGTINDSISYSVWDGPLSPSRLLVNQAARNDCAKGDYGKCISRVGMSVLEMMPIAKGPSIAGKLSKGLSKPEPPKPSTLASKNIPGRVDSNGTRRFTSNPDGEEYGENVLGHQYKDLDPDLKNAVKSYTHRSWPYQRILRSPNRKERIEEIKRLINTSGGEFEAWHQRWIKGPKPTASNAPETLDSIEDQISKIDNGLKNPLPEGVDLKRGVSELDFFSGYNGDPTSLKGKTHQEAGYTSGSLGSEPAFKHHPYHIEINVPKGSHGTWIGKNSEYDDQREMILPRNTKYRFTDVYQDPSTGIWILKAEVIP